jgi:hypothetical protein
LMDDGAHIIGIFGTAHAVEHNPAHGDHPVSALRPDLPVKVECEAPRHAIVIRGGMRARHDTHGDSYKHEGRKSEFVHHRLLALFYIQYWGKRRILVFCLVVKVKISICYSY